MRIFGLDIFKSDPTKTRVDVDYINQLASGDAKAAQRTSLGQWDAIGDGLVLYPRFPIPREYLYDIAVACDVIRTTHKALRTKIFRNGLEIESVVDNPDEEQKQKLQDFIISVNDNKQSLLKLSKQGNDDLEISDDVFILMTKVYYFNGNNELMGTNPVELLRVDTRYIDIIADRTGRPAYDQNGNEVKFCVNHRDEVHTGMTHCPICGVELQPAFYRYRNVEGGFTYYSGDEIFHTSKYSPSLTYGYSNIFSIWMKANTLISQDKYMLDYYAKQRPPRGMLFINTSNQQGLTKAWNFALDLFKKNPHTIPPIAVDTPSNSRGSFVQFIDFMKSLDEMQYESSRNEMRRAIGSIYGVMPLFHADISTSGGMNNEGMQITVTNQATQEGQGIWNDEIYPWICTQLDITDYRLLLPPNEEQDEMRDEELFNQKIINAQLLQQMGYTITLTPQRDFEYDPLDEEMDVPIPSIDSFNHNQPPKENPRSTMSGEPKQDRSELSGAPLDTHKQVKKKLAKDGGMVSSSTSGVNNPCHSRRIRHLSNIVRTVQTQIAKEENINIPIEKADEGIDTLAEVMENAIYEDSFDDMDRSISEKIKDYIIRSISRGYKSARVVNYIKNKGNIPLARANNIYRTESHAIRTEARDFSYDKIDPDNSLKFKWLGPADHRRTTICGNITRRTAHGVTRPELRGIIQDEVDKAIIRGELPTDYDARRYNPHFSCRHSMVRSF